MSRTPRQDGLFAPNVFFQFFLTTQPLGRLIERALGPNGLKPNEYGVLSAVDELEPVMPSDIARVTGMPRPTLTAYIERLVAGGHVKRVKNSRDGRSYRLALTAKGRRTKDRNGRAIRTALESIEAQLEDGPEEVVAVLARLRSAAEAVLSADEAATSKK